MSVARPGESCMHVAIITAAVYFYGKHLGGIGYDPAPGRGWWWRSGTRGHRRYVASHDEAIREMESYLVDRWALNEHSLGDEPQ